MTHGVVKWFDSKKGFGFIESEAHPQDIFVHFSDIVEDGFKKLRFGDRVEFELVTSDKGVRAKNVSKVSDPEAVPNGAVERG